MKRTVEHVDVEGKFVLMRADFNVPLDDEARITDDRRIVQALPTIRNILQRDGRLILMSHLGRPRSEHDASLSLRPVARRLGVLLEQDVALVENYVRDPQPEEVAALRKGRVVLLENLRFHPEETIKNKDAERDPAIKIRKRQFARKLADLADVYVNDAFGTCHRDNASMVTVPLLMNDKPKVVGFLVQRELEMLDKVLSAPASPFVCVLGGAKVSDKIGIIEALVPKCDKILIGGAMAFTFMLARDQSVGDSLAEPDNVHEAQRLLELAGDKLHVPVDNLCAREITEGAETRICEGSIDDGLKGVDIGPRTIAGYCDILATAKTIVWNGPMGVFETRPFDAGTAALAEAVARATTSGALSIVGGGDSAAAIIAAGLDQSVTHVSTGGGATLEFLEGKRFEAIEVLDD